MNTKKKYYVHANYMISTHDTWEEAVERVRKEIKKSPGEECRISKDVSCHEYKVTVGKIIERKM